MCSPQAHHGNTFWPHMFPAMSSCVNIQQYLPNHFIIYNRSPFHRHLLTLAPISLSLVSLFNILFCLQDTQCGKTRQRGPPVRQDQEAQVEGWWGVYSKVPFVNLVKCTRYTYSPGYKQFTQINLHQQHNQNNGRWSNSPVTIKEWAVLWGLKSQSHWKPQWPWPPRQWHLG